MPLPPILARPQVFSMFLPRGVNLRTKCSWAGDKDHPDFSVDDSRVLIVDGQVRPFCLGEGALEQAAAAFSRAARARWRVLQQHTTRRWPLHRGSHLRPHTYDAHNPYPARS